MGRVAATLIDQLWSAIEALPDPEPQPDPKRPSKQEARMIAREVKFVTDSLLEERRFELSVPP